MKKMKTGLVAGVLACAFAFTTPMLVGCGDDQKIKDLETQITTLTDENTALKAEKEELSFKSDVVAVLSLAGLMGYGCANDSREARDYFFEGRNTFDNAVELEAWSLVVKNYLPQVKPNQLYKIVATRDNKSMSYYFKVNYANGEYDFALAREQDEDNIMTNWKVKYDGLNYKEFHLKTWLWDAEDGFVCDFSYNVVTDIVASWSEVSGIGVDADIVTDLKSQFAALKTEASSIPIENLIEVNLISNSSDSFVTDTTCKIVFNLNGAPGSLEYVEIPKGESFDDAEEELPTPSWAAHTFEGWYLKSDCTGERFTEATVVNKNTRLYAKWSSN